jgi:esterase/lipase
MDHLHTIVGALCGVLLVVEMGYRKAVVTTVLMGGFLTLQLGRRCCPADRSEYSAPAHQAAQGTSRGAA